VQGNEIFDSLLKRASIDHERTGTRTKDLRRAHNMVRFLPREHKFFEMFADMSANLAEGARLMRNLLKDFQDVSAQVARLKEIEHRGDDMTHAVITKLNQTFITPFDREDIHKLASSLDDVLDYINSAGDRIVTYKIGGAPREAYELAEIIVQQCQELGRAISHLDKRKNSHVLEYCVEVNRLENEADAVSRRAIGKLFDQEKDPIALIKLKELYEVLEMATDKAEDVANVLESVVLKSA
jgi:predicted phosphate transport protein (TIGR00153 family)